jgi:hypothetical protein
MNKKHIAIALIVGVLVGTVAGNYVRKIPVIGPRLPVIG